MSLSLGLQIDNNITIFYVLGWNFEDIQNTSVESLLSEGPEPTFVTIVSVEAKLF